LILKIETKKAIEYWICVAVLVLPSFFLVIVGSSFIWSSLVGYFIVILTLDLLLAIIIPGLSILRDLASKDPIRRTPVGQVPPSWIRLHDIWAILMLLDTGIIVFFLEFSKYSQYSQTVALYLMALFLPMIYFASTFFRDGFISLIYFKKYYYNIRDQSTILWVSSSLAKVLLRLHKESGINYLRKSLAAARNLFERSGRTSDSLNDAISLLNFIWVTGIDIDYNKLLSFANSVFTGDHFKLEQLPDLCSKLVSGFDWFPKTKPLEEYRREQSFFEKFRKYFTRALGTAGVLSILVAVFESFGKSLNSLAAALQPQELTILVVVFALLVSIFPALRFKALLGISVRLSDLTSYQEEYSSLEPRIYETYGI
jgi:hypothetical protein